jgi:hypothetical protein
MTTWKTTWTLVGAAALLFAFIYFFERRMTPTDAPAPPPAALLKFKASEVTVVQLRRTNQFVLRAERTNQNWNITAPISYPAERFAVELLLNSLAGLFPSTYIGPDELKAQKKSIAEFGLDVPLASLTLQHAGRRSEVLFGSRTPAGDQAYVQLANQPGIYVVPAEINRLLPRNATDWRDIALINLEGLNLDRFEVRSPGRGFVVQVNPTNLQFYLSKPITARADRSKVVALLRKLQEEKVLSFVSDDPRSELETYGFQPPEAEAVFGIGTNDLVTVQFGKSPSNDVVYARRMLNNNVVLVSRSALEAVQLSASDLRDRHLLSFPDAAVDRIEVAGNESFTLQRRGSNSWMITEPQPLLADPELVRETINLLATLEGNVEKDVVIDFGSYGLAQPLRQYFLKASTTNANGGLTNRLLTQLDVGGRRDGSIFARGPESTVYAVDRVFLDRLPSSAWQLRDRRVWSFTTNQIVRLTISHNGNTRQLVRGTGGEWKLEAGSIGILNNTHAIEETVFRLGELRAAVWVDRGEGKRQLYGFRENADKLLLELKGGEKPQTLTVEFGDKAQSGYPYALATVDGQSLIFEFPLQLYIQVAQRLLNSVPAPVSAQIAP